MVLPFARAWERVNEATSYCTHQREIINVLALPDFMHYRSCNKFYVREVSALRSVLAISVQKDNATVHPEVKYLIASVSALCWINLGIIQWRFWAAAKLQGTMKKVKESFNHVAKNVRPLFVWSS
jgi:hypothetical protein